MPHESVGLASSEENPEALFRLALQLKAIDPIKAAQIFKKLAQQEEGISPAATYQWLLLLAEQKEWQTISYERPLFSQLDPIGYFYLGISSFEQKMFHQAKTDLQKCVGKDLPRDLEQRALIALLSSAQQLKECDLCSVCFHTLCKDFPSTRPEAALILASAYQNSGRESEALLLFSQVGQEYEGTPFAQEAGFHLANLLFKQNKLSEAREALASFFKAFPQAEKKIEATSLSAEITLALRSEKESYDHLIKELESGLKAHLFYKEEKSEKEHLLAQAYLKMGNGKAALKVLEGTSEPDPFLMTQCYVHEKESEKVIVWGKKALEHHSEEPHLHLHLFNAYRELIKENQDTVLTREAAKHLTVAIDKIPTPLENRLWLAVYHCKDEPQKTIALLEPLLHHETNFKKFDQQAFLLAKLYQEDGRLEAAATLLEKMLSQQLKTADETKLQLAEIYSAQGKKEEAKKLYQKLEESPKHHVASWATLHLARLNFPLCPEKSLLKLQQLAIPKTLAAEPVHLEAALDYAELKTSLCPQEIRSEQLLTLLRATKEQFSEQSGVRSKEYHEKRLLLSEKDLIYQAYMRYLDAKIYMLEAQCVSDEGEKNRKLKAAKALFSTLVSGKYAVTDYLKQRATAALYENL